LKLSTIEKSMAASEITAEQLETINRYTRRELKAEEVFVFSVILCDNEIDRDFEQFPKDSLEKLAELYKGKTGVFDHRPNAENQSARIFDTEIIAADSQNSVGEQYICLKAFAYMVRCEKNSDLILEIDAGIKKEVSVGCAVEKTICSICGADTKNGGCNHSKGKEYDGKLCYYLLINPTDAYEWSFVAVPAQKNAGVVKGYNDSVKMLDRHEATFEKLFLADEDVIIAKSQMQTLAREYAQLKAFAKIGEEHTESMKHEAVRLMLIAQPELDSDIAKSVVEKMDNAQLKEFAKIFGKAAAEKLPIMPQLVQSSTEKTGKNDSQFRI